MNDYLLSILIGIVEGLTEFLPVSSTAHIRLVESLFDISLKDGFWKTYSIVIQLGAILCLPIYFREKIIRFLRSFPKGETGKSSLINHPLTLIALAFLVTAVPSFLLSKIIGENLESLYVIGYALLIGGIAMWAIDASKAKWETAGEQATGNPIHVWRMEDLGLKRALFIGACQILAAVFPGTSRSMATIAGGQLAGVSRAAALEFSFFLSMPTIAAATGYSLLKALHEGISLDSHQWIVLAIGFVVSFLVAYAAVAWFMGWVRKKGFVPFAIYRIVLGILVLIVAYKQG